MSSRPRRTNAGVAANRLADEQHDIRTRATGTRAYTRRQKCMARLSSGAFCRELRESDKIACAAHLPKRLAGIDMPIREWPTIPTDEELVEWHKEFKEHFSEANYRQKTCAICGCMRNTNEISLYAAQKIHEFDNILAVPPDFLPFLKSHHEDEWEELFTYGDPALDFNILESRGITTVESDGDEVYFQVCGECKPDLARCKRPSQSLANGNWVGPVPPQLACLNLAEATALGLSRHSMRSIFFLKSTNNDPESRFTASKGHTVAWPQYVSNVVDAITSIPAHPNELADKLHISLVGPPPYDLATLDKTFSVCRTKLLNAWNFLKTRNPFFSNLSWNRETANMYNGTIPTTIARTEVHDPAADASERTGYVPEDEGDLGIDDEENMEAEISCSGMVDVDGIGVSHQDRRRAAVLNLLDPQNRTNPEGHRPTANETEENSQRSRHVPLSRTDGLESMYDAELLPKLFFTLYPYGVGGFFDKRTSAYQSSPPIRDQIKAQMLYTDQRFAEHQNWIFLVFDSYQRMQVNMRASVRFKRNAWSRIAEQVTEVTTEELHELLEVIEREEYAEASPRVQRLLRECQWITGGMVGSQEAKAVSRKELKAMITAFGQPGWWFTINPPDGHSALLLKFANGDQIDLDALTGRRLYSAVVRKRIAAKNPVATARFFKAVMQGFIDILLRPSRDGSSVGIFGNCLATYATIENQGRGSLHAHGMAWLHGHFTPEEVFAALNDEDTGLRQRLIEFVDKILKQDFEGIPDDADDVEMMDVGDGRAAQTDRCFEQAPDPNLFLQDADLYMKLMEKDRLKVGKKTLYHRCNSGCLRRDYKGKPYCRYGFPRKLVENTYITDEGDIKIRRRHEKTNNHNPLVTSLLRCNNDLKQLLIGPQALSSLHYMTKYATKNELALRRFFALSSIAVEMHRRKANPAHPATARAKDMIVKCCNRIGAEMEIPAVSAAYFLLYNQDHFSSETFTPLYLQMFNSHLEADLKHSAGDVANIHTEMEASQDIAETTHEEEAADTGSAVAQDAPAAFNNATTDDVGLGEFVSVKVGFDEDETTEHNQSDDYRFRSADLEDECLYMLVSRFGSVNMTQYSEKERGSNRRATSANRAFHFLPEHPRSSTHMLREYNEPKVPVLEGRTIPSPDHESEAVRTRYAKGILLLFKPWRKATDLLEGHQSWIDALDAFKPIDPDINRYIANLNLLHVMNAEARRQSRERAEEGTRQYVGDGEDQLDRDLTANELPAEQMSEEQWEQIYSIQTAAPKDSEWTTNAMDICERAGVFEHSTKQTFANGGYSDGRTKSIWVENRMDKANAIDWSKAMDAQDEWLEKKRRGIKAPNPERRARVDDDDDDDDDAIAQQQGQQETSGDAIPEQLHIESFVDFNGEANPVTFAAAAGLNKKQSMAFLLQCIAFIDKLISKQAPTVRCLIVGAGGVGKSVVLKTFTNWLRLIGCEHLLRRAGPTGTSASLIGGATIHKLIGYRRKKKATGEGTEAISDSYPTEINLSDAVEQEWKDVLQLAVDEVSMISHSILHKVHLTLASAKHNDEDFGGINMFYLGDFAQFPPVAGIPLYKDLCEAIESAKSKNGEKKQKIAKLSPHEKHAFNKWNALTDCIVMKEQMRQEPGESELRHVLDNMRNGNITGEDHKVLSSRVVGKQAVPSFNSVKWQGATLISPRHSLRREYNKKQAIAMAKANDQPLYVYAAKYTTSRGKMAVEPQWIEQLVRKPPTKHSNMESALYLTLGMPVVLTANEHQEQGWTNGAYGDVVGIVLSKEDRDARTEGAGDPVRLKKPPAQILVKLRQQHDDRIQLEGLEEDVVAIEPSSGTAQVLIKRWYDPLTKRQHEQTFTASFHQSPLMAAFAITDYRSQGGTMGTIIADLVPTDKGNNAAAAYVTCSRVKTLEGMAFIREFRMSDLVREVDPDLKAEWERHEKMEKVTIARLQDRLDELGWREAFEEHILSQKNAEGVAKYSSAW